MVAASKGPAKEEEPAEESGKVRRHEDQQKMVKQKPRVGALGRSEQSVTSHETSEP